MKTDGTLWAWGSGTIGEMGNNKSHPGSYVSSPTQIPGTTWDEILSNANYSQFATKTDGTLWAWGANNSGALAQDDTVNRSSPVQIPGTWDIISSAGHRYGNSIITKTS